MSVYKELFNFWKLEVETNELSSIPSDFYVKIAEYVKQIKKDGRMIDKKSLKKILLNKELVNVQHMIKELIFIRFQKMLTNLARNKNIHSDVFTSEEKTLHNHIISYVKLYRKFGGSIIYGEPPSIKIKESDKRVLLRFSSNIPEFIGADMNYYGPFQVEDIASLPEKNSEIFIRKGVADLLEF